MHAGTWEKQPTVSRISGTTLMAYMFISAITTGGPFFRRETIMMLSISIMLPSRWISNVVPTDQVTSNGTVLLYGGSAHQGLASALEECEQLVVTDRGAS